ncbi:hypothetical protein MB14_12725 [Roseivirga ehrenbergii]|uniref:Uncharacterized protein n=1 Tax=Roseivirga ehrenbergii (strain DSM 102268 / JCM 13514 / KCTC 12282 / NCIMB 14502 / KMM 6017) TaxID=279360 RepID=A0A150XRY0_ROSEK|nr:hypothetical protein MB14_12725 [Roseivirga ehrenbergii]
MILLSAFFEYYTKSDDLNKNSFFEAANLGLFQRPPNEKVLCQIWYFYSDKIPTHLVCLYL